MSGWSGLRNLVRLRDVFRLRWNSPSLKAPGSTCARTSVAGCVGPQLGLSPPPPARRQLSSAVAPSGAPERVPSLTGRIDAALF